VDTRNQVLVASAILLSTQTAFSVVTKAYLWTQKASQLGRHHRDTTHNQTPNNRYNNNQSINQSILFQATRLILHKTLTHTHKHTHTPSQILD